METLLTSDVMPDSGKAMIGGILVGVLFGWAAQRSQFCLRAACVEFWRGALGPKLALWLTVFASALLFVQLGMTMGWITAGSVRQLESAGTMSGAILGGLTFGVGMVLARGCASRLLVLSATGNLRALIAGLIVTVAAQASLTGVLSPLRETLSALWIVSASTRNLPSVLPEHTGLIAGLASVTLAAALVWKVRLSPRVVVGGLGVGLAVALGWVFTSTLSALAFDPVPVESVSFTGPSADTLMALIYRPLLEPSFGVGLVPGVFLGSLISALTSRGFRVQTFDQSTGFSRYLIGAVLMGFGGMLAGGCAVGAGVTGGSVLSLTAWVALAAMWVGAGLADRVIDAPYDLGPKPTLSER